MRIRAANSIPAQGAAPRAPCARRFTPVSISSLLGGILVALWLALFGAPASAQTAARLQILNAGINLGWVSGIVESEGVSAANITEIGTDLANATAAISALLPLIDAALYDETAFVRVNRRIALLSSKIGGMPKEQAAWEISSIYHYLQSALRVFHSARTNSLQVGGTCDASTLDVGFYFGQGHTALLRSNLILERRAREAMMHAAQTGTEVAKSIPCPGFGDFPGAGYLSAPVLKKPTAATYAASLPVIQTVASTGALPGGMAPSPATSIPMAMAPPAPPPPPAGAGAGGGGGAGAGGGAGPGGLAQYTVIPGAFINGRGIGTAEDGHTPDSCAARCDAEPRCLSFEMTGGWCSINAADRQTQSDILTFVDAYTYYERNSP